MTILWVVIVAAVVAALAKGAARLFEREESHIGFVSHRWLAERRASDMSDPRR
jgi:hypothetical protein